MPNQVVQPYSWINVDKSIPIAPVDRSFTIDEKIEIWEMGRKQGSEEGYTKGELVGIDKGREEAIEIFTNIGKVLTANIETSHSDTQRLIETFKGLGFNPNNAFLKIENAKCLDVLILLPEKEYLSDSISKAYSTLMDFESEIETADYSVHYSICEFSDDLDMECLRSDGYFGKLNA